MRNLLTDTDGVLLNWIGAFETYVNEEFGYVTKDDSHYDLAARFGLEISLDQQIKMISDFNHSEKIGQLEPYKDSKEVVKQFTDLGFKFTVITSLSKQDSACKMRVENLERVFGVDTFEDFVFLDIGQSKGEALDKFAGSGRYWLEDLPKNALDGHNRGLKTILFNHSYNKSFSHNQLKRVDMWKEVYEHITENA